MENRPKNFSRQENTVVRGSPSRNMIYSGHVRSIMSTWEKGNKTNEKPSWKSKVANVGDQENVNTQNRAREPQWRNLSAKSDEYVRKWNTAADNGMDIRKSAISDNAWMKNKDESVAESRDEVEAYASRSAGQSSRLALPIDDKCNISDDGNKISICSSSDSSTLGYALEKLDVSTDSFSVSASEASVTSSRKKVTLQIDTDAHTNKIIRPSQDNVNVRAESFQKTLKNVVGDTGSHPSSMGDVNVLMTGKVMPSCASVASTESSLMYSVGNTIESSELNRSEKFSKTYQYFGNGSHSRSEDSEDDIDASDLVASTLAECRLLLQMSPPPTPMSKSSFEYKVKCPQKLQLKKNSVAKSACSIGKSIDSLDATTLPSPDNSGASVSSLNKFLQCPCCSEDFQEEGAHRPLHSFACDHIICHQCVVKSTIASPMNSNMVSCPECGERRAFDKARPMVSRGYCSLLKKLEGLQSKKHSRFDESSSSTEKKPVPTQIRLFSPSNNHHRSQTVNSLDFTEDTEVNSLDHSARTSDAEANCNNEFGVEGIETSIKHAITDNINENESRSNISTSHRRALTLDAGVNSSRLFCSEYEDQKKEKETENESNNSTNHRRALTIDVGANYPHDFATTDNDQDTSLVLHNEPTTPVSRAELRFLQRKGRLTQSLERVSRILEKSKANRDHLSQKIEETTIQEETDIDMRTENDEIVRWSPKKVINSAPEANLKESDLKENSKGNDDIFKVQWGSIEENIDQKEDAGVLDNGFLESQWGTRNEKAEQSSDAVVLEEKKECTPYEDDVGEKRGIGENFNDAWETLKEKGAGESGELQPRNQRPKGTTRRLLPELRVDTGVNYNVAGGNTRTVITQCQETPPRPKSPVDSKEQANVFQLTDDFIQPDKKDTFAAFEGLTVGSSFNGQSQFVVFGANDSDSVSNGSSLMDRDNHHTFLLSEHHEIKPTGNFKNKIQDCISGSAEKIRKDKIQDDKRCPQFLPSLTYSTMQDSDEYVRLAKKSDCSAWNNTSGKSMGVGKKLTPQKIFQKVKQPKSEGQPLAGGAFDDVFRPKGWGAITQDEVQNPQRNDSTESQEENGVVTSLFPQHEDYGESVLPGPTYDFSEASSLASSYDDDNQFGALGGALVTHKPKFHSKILGKLGLKKGKKYVRAAK